VRNGPLGDAEPQRRRNTHRPPRPSANMASPANTDAIGSVATSTTQPISPSAFSQRGQRRSSPVCVNADAFAIA
jgi:hypothetical protein